MAELNEKNTITRQEYEEMKQNIKTEINTIIRKMETMKAQIFEEQNALAAEKQLFEEEKKEFERKKELIKSVSILDILIFLIFFPYLFLLY